MYTMKRILLALGLIVFFVTAPLTVNAQTNAPTPPSTQSTQNSSCGTTKTQFIACDSKTGVGTINDLIRIGVIVLTVLIGIVAVAGIAYAAILYASARDNQSQVSESITIIRNIVIGLLLYGFTIAIINWLLPGSVIG